MDQNHKEKLEKFSKLIQDNKYDPQVLSQIYKILNYKVTQYQNQPQSIPIQEISEFLSVKNNRVSHGHNSNANDLQNDIRYYDEDKIKELVLKQKFLISKGYFDPKQNFPSIKLTSLDDYSQDHKISAMIDPNYNHRI